MKMMENSNQYVIISRDLLVSIAQDLRSLDVRGYESNEKRVDIVRDLQKILVTNIPLEITPTSGDTSEEVK